MEKTLYNQVGEVKGASSENEDSFSFQFTPQNENLKRTRGTLFTLVSISGKTDDRFEKAKAIYHQFQSSYYARASGSILHGLSDTLEQLVKNSLDKEADQGLKVSIIAAVFWGTVVYLSKHGEGAVFVARTNKVKKLDFAKVASGVLEDQDTVCLASERFVEQVSVEDLNDVLTKEKFEDTLKLLDSRIEKTEGAVCDVIRLSVNAPQEELQALSIAEVDEKGNIEPAASPQPADKTSEAVEAEVANLAEEEPEKLQEEKRIDKPESRIDPFDQPVIRKSTKIKVLIEKAQSLLKVFVVKISKPWRKGEPGEHFDPVATRRARIAQVAGVVLVVLIVSLGFTVFSRGSGKKDTRVSELINSVEGDLNEASNIKTIDPTRALILVDQAQKDLSTAKKLDSENQKVDSLEDRSNDLEAEITKTTVIKNLETVFDFSKLKKDTAIADLGLLGEQMLLLDRNLGTVYNLFLNDKTATELSGESLEAETVASFPGGFYVSGQRGITKVDTGLKQSSVGSNANWGKIVGAATYQSNLYLLDTEKNEVWLYRSTSLGLSSAKAYTVGEKPDLSKAVAITIDDYVWVATKNGNIYKFASGKKQGDFTISGLADPIGELEDMFTSSASKNHYLLDKGKGRVIAVDKTGAYLAAYAHAELHKADSLVVSEETSTGYFTAENKLYQFKLP